LLLDKTKAEEAMLDLEKEKSSWTSDKGDFEKKIGDLGEIWPKPMKQSGEWKDGIV